MNRNLHSLEVPIDSPVTPKSVLKSMIALNPIGVILSSRVSVLPNCMTIRGPSLIYGPRRGESAGIRSQRVTSKMESSVEDITAFIFPSEIAIPIHALGHAMSSTDGGAVAGLKSFFYRKKFDNFYDVSNERTAMVSNVRKTFSKFCSPCKP